MNIETAWVEAPSTIGGLDHLGAQAPCVLIYGQLLPGITNVTDRARYYSFYPWVIWSLDQRFPDDAGEAKFVERFRAADCLFTLIAEHHSQYTDRISERHGTAMVGRQKLVSAVQRLKAGTTLTLRDFTDKDSPQRYFLNQMGGLSQYYAGTLADLNVLDGSKKPWFRYSKQVGKPLAEALDVAVPANVFWNVIECGQVTDKDLQGLHAFCPCHLCCSSPREHQQLVDIYFDRQHVYDEDGAQRRRSLGLILRLINSLPSTSEFSESVFRAAVYGSALANGTPWTVPPNLESTRQNWAMYVRNDLFSVAAQTIFSLTLNKLSPQSVSEHASFDSVESFAQAFKEDKEVKALVSNAQCSGFGHWLDGIERVLPLVSNWSRDDHEICLAKRMVASWGKIDDAALLELATRVIAILIIRDDLSRSAYEGLAITPQALHDYPLNLYSLRQKAIAWRAMPIDGVVADLVSWCMNTHLRVSLRKLHRTGQATFRFRPSERGLQPADDGIPIPSRTAPRFRQALQILTDVGAVLRGDNDSAVLSSDGKQLMEAASV